MKKIIDTQTTDNPNDFGEILREYCFTNKGYGCYENFELISEFKKIEDIDFIERILKSNQWWGEFYLSDKLDSMDYEMQQSITLNLLNNCYTKGNITIAWFWDGDGTLVIREGNRIAINNDCKKDYNWEWLDES